MHTPAPRGLSLFWTKKAKAIQTSSTTYEVLSSCSQKFTAVRDDLKNRRIKIISQMSKARGSSRNSSRVFRLTILLPFSLLLPKETSKNKLCCSAWLLASISVAHFSVSLQTSPMFENKWFYLLDYMKCDFLLDCMRFFCSINCFSKKALPLGDH